VLTDDGFAKLGISSDADLPAGGKLERDASGKPTGAVTGGQAAIIALFDRLPRPTYAEQVEGTEAFFTELNRLGLTGVVDPGGNNLLAGDYQALFDVWRHRALTVRVAYTLNGQTAGKELEELQGLTALLPMGFGDDMLKFNGIGERITLAMNNNPSPSDADKEQYYRVVKWAADHGLSLTMHWGPDATVHHLLDVFERVNRDVPIAPLRWSIAHLNDASEQSLARMHALGVAMGAGTDAHRVASYNPFTALQWFLDGKTVSGAAIRGPEETPGRLDALRLYTLGSAWFSFDEDNRGSLEPGKLADLAVLSADYLTVPVDAVGRIEALLTLVDGKIVYAAGPFAALRPGAR
jgi:predicted amidohydrolase YtcJ